jgi:hypothetical protein
VFEVFILGAGVYLPRMAHRAAATAVVPIGTPVPADRALLGVIAAVDHQVL